MKRLALLVALGAVAGPALAADLPPPMVPQAPSVYFPVAPLYSWTGFYIGANAGAGWNRGGVSDTLGTVFSSSNTKSTFLGGGQFGANYQFGPSGSGVVVGAEAMFDWLSNNQNTVTGTNPTLGSANVTLNNRWLTTATGKLGYAWDRVLLYGKGGFAWVGNGNSTPIAGISLDSTSWGWTGGLGVEWAFLGNWSVRAEYDYIGIQSQNFGVSSGPFLNDSVTTNNRSIQMVTAGINYKIYGPGTW
jgi:outer membrane immunogenic protein